MPITPVTHTLIHWNVDNMFPLSALLTRMIHTGTLTVTDAAGGLHTFGGRIPGPAVTLKLSDPGLYRSLVFNSELAAGEAYMDGTLTFPGSSLRAFLDLMSINRNDRPPTPIQRALGTAAKPFKRFQQSNPIGRAQQNIAPVRLVSFLRLSGTLSRLETEKAPLEQPVVRQVFADGDETCGCERLRLTTFKEVFDDTGRQIGEAACALTDSLA